MQLKQTPEAPGSGHLCVFRNPESSGFQTPVPVSHRGLVKIGAAGPCTQALAFPVLTNSQIVDAAGVKHCLSKLKKVPRNYYNLNLRIVLVSILARIQ